MRSSSSIIKSESLAASPQVLSSEWSHKVALRALVREAAASTLKKAMVDPENAAQDILAQAMQKAEALIAEARQKADEAYEQAVARGYDEGFAQGLAAAENEAAKLLSALEAAVQKVSALKGKIMREAQRDLVEMSIAVSAKVIGTLAAENPKVTEAAVADALSRVKMAAGVSVRVHPDVCDYLAAKRAELAGLAEGVRSIEFVPDPRIELGGCVVEADTGAIDATVGGKLTEVRKVLVASQSEAVAGDVERDGGGLA